MLPHTAVELAELLAHLVKPGYGLEIVEQLPIRVVPNPHNARYLLTKREKLGHLL